MVNNDNVVPAKRKGVRAVYRAQSKLSKQLHSSILTIMQNIDVILDPGQIRISDSMRSKMLEDYSHFNLHWLKSSDWVAVPGIGNGPFDDKELARLSEVFDELSIRECWAILTEELGKKEKLYKFRPSEKNLVSFRIECNGFYYLLTDAASSFGILCTAYDFFVYAGSRQIVEAMSGTSVETGKQKYLEYAKSWPVWDRDVFEGIAKRYKEFS